MSGARRARPRRLRRAAVASILGLVTVLALAGCSEDAAPKVTTLPQVTLKPLTGGGDPVKLSELKGPLVVNVWASWCTPCRKEMPIVQKYSVKHPDVKVLGIDYSDPQTGAALELVADSGVTYDLLADPDELINGASPFPRINNMPFWAVVDADGTVVHQQYKVVRSVADMEAMVDGALGR